MDTPMSLLKYLPSHCFIPSCPPPSFNPRFSSLSSISGSISVTRPRCFPSVSRARHPWPKHAASPVTALQWEGDVEVSSVDVGDEGTEDVEEAPLPVELYETEAAIAVKDYRESLAQRLKSDDEELETGKKKRKKKTRDEHLVPQQVPDRLLPKVAIIGRPNVGKSALFNRIAGRDVAIVNDEPGVTRDRLYARAFWGLHEFMLVDTGGVLTVPKSDTLSIDGIAITGGGGQNAIAQAVQEATAAGLPSMIERQAAAALENSSVILFVVDGQAGVSSADIDIADWLRKKHSDKKIILAVNKCESPTKGLLQAAEFWSLGFDPVAVSAISGRGTGDLLDYVCSGLKLPQAAENEDENEDRIPAIAIVGRPNVGKSSILNALVGEERTIVSPVSGTTRDAIDTEITTPEGQIYCLIDTAGIRRRAAIASAGSKTESLSVNRAFRAIRRSDVVALVIDAMDCVTEQDYRLGERIESEGKGCVIVINKWDTIPEKDSKTSFYYEQDVRENLRVLDWAPIVFTSAVNSPSIYRILQKAISVEKERSRRLSTAILNQVVQEAMALQQPPRSKGGKKGRIYYCTQAAIRPPTFVFFVNDAKLFSEVYRRYMEKQLRSNVGYPGTPIRLLWRSKRKPEREKGSTVAAATVVGPS